MIVNISVILEHKTPASRAGIDREAQIQRPHRQINDVRRHARGPSAAVSHPGTVIVRIVRQRRIERPERSRPAPEVPVQTEALRGLLRRHPADAIRMLIQHIEGPYGADVTEVSRTHIFHNAPVVFRGMDLRADLANPLVFIHRVAQGETFAQVHSHRLLHIKILSCFTRRNAHECVPMWRCGDDHCVQVLLLQHFTVILVPLAGVLEALHDDLQPRIPDIACRRHHHIREPGADVEV